MQLLGCKHHHTTAYHPIANGIIERFHRHLKAALKAQTTTHHWMETLPLALLSIRTSVKADLQLSVAELLYGTTLRLPGQFFEKTVTKGTIDPGSFVARLRDSMREVNPPPSRPYPHRNVHINKDLSSCTHVFVRNDKVRKPLQAPYDGPYKVVGRAEKYFTLERDGHRDTVSLNRLKPAYLDSMPHASEPSSCSQPASPTPAVEPTRTTRCGRHVHFPDRLMSFIPSSLGGE